MPDEDLDATLPASGVYGPPHPNGRNITWRIAGAGAVTLLVTLLGTLFAGAKVEQKMMARELAAIHATQLVIQKDIQRLQPDEARFTWSHGLRLEERITDHESAGPHENVRESLDRHAVLLREVLAGQAVQGEKLSAIEAKLAQ